METRYYFIFTAAIILLQLLIYIFNKTLIWWLNKPLSPRTRRAITFVSFLLPNVLVICHFLKLFTVFRLIALMLALLLFSAFASIAVGGIHFLFRKSKSIIQIDRTLRIAYPILFIGITTLSVYNAYVTRVIHYEITLDKPIKPLRIGMASDLHLGKLFGGKELDKLADIMQQEKVDIILLPGDIMDDNVNAYLAEKMQPHLAKLKAPMGVYATLGNHDLFGDQDRIDQEIRKAGITVLRDETLTLNNELVLIGRNDNLAHDRPSTETLLKQVNTDLPIILLDHRPTDIEKHTSLPLDIQVSGHAHKGQVFPASLITKMMYRLDYGHEKIGNLHVFVTSGYGFWGIPMRLGSQSEVIIIDVKGK